MLVLGLSLAAPVSAQVLPEPLRPETGVLRIVRLEEPPTLDGRLDEAAWAGAAVARDFEQTYPAAGVPARLDTEVRLAFDDRALYVAVRAEEEPTQVRAGLHRRDELGDDDLVALYLDALGSGARAHLVRLNPLGVVADGVFLEGTGTDLSPDLEVTAVGRITELGYVIEAAIPWRSLRLPEGEHPRLGLHLLRQARHRQEESSWQSLRVENAVRFPQERTVLLRDRGFLELAERPASGIELEVIPAATFDQREPRAEEAERETNLGATVRARLRHNLSLELAIEPQFAEVEPDPPLLTVNQPFPIFLPERRPFFVEGIDLLRTRLSLVDTRRIEAPEGALKMVWQSERNAFAALAARDRPSAVGSAEADAAILRGRHQLAKESFVGLLATGRSEGERDNLLLAADGRLRLDDETTLAFVLAGTSTEGRFYDPDQDAEVPRQGQGLAYLAELERKLPQRSWRLTGQGFTRDFRADLGYVQRTDTNRWLGELRLSPPARTEGRLVSWAFVQTSLFQFDNQGRSQYAYLYPQLELDFRRQLSLDLAAYADYIRIFEEDYGPRRSATRPGAFSGDPERSTHYQGCYGTFSGDLSKALSFELSLGADWSVFDYDFGAGPKYPRVSPAALADPEAPLDPGPGDSTSAALALQWQPGERWQTSLRLSRDRLVRQDTGRTAYAATLATLRVEHHLTRSLFVRLRADFDSIASQVTARGVVGYQPFAGTAVFLGYDDLRQVDAPDLPGRPRSRDWLGLERAWFLKVSLSWKRGL